MQESVYLDLFFMFIGLALFVAMIWFVEAWEDKRYNRKVMEAREFGFRGSRLERDAQDTDPPS